MTTHYLKIILPLITLTGCNSDSKTSAEINPQATTEYTLLSSYSYNMSVLNSTNIHSKWSSLRIIKENPNEALYYPDVATDGKGVLISVWQSEYNPLYGGEYDVVFSASYDNGVTWSTPIYVNQTTISDDKTDYFNQFDMNDSGYGVVSWAGEHDSSDLDIYAAITHDFGESWSQPTLINNYALSETCMSNCNQV